MILNGSIMAGAVTAARPRPTTVNEATVRTIMGMVLGRQRQVDGHPDRPLCEACLRFHRPSFDRYLTAGAPIRFILPAFPAKSPNPRKVLGHLPDLAEELALTSLDQLCRQIESIYPPGAQIIICSDGRVFSDAVRIADEHVSAYQKGMKTLLAALKLDTLSLWGLDEIYPGLAYADMRASLMFNHGEPAGRFRQQVAAGGHAEALYRGITRFLYEDADRSGAASNSALQRDCRRRAYTVIERSQAWSNLLEQQFPDAVRLSIHPQPCGTKKIGIHLTDVSSGDQWLTPWHAVAVREGDNYLLMKRSDAEAAGGTLIRRHGRPSHYTLGPHGVQHSLRTVDPAAQHQ